jgi:hypothetical protein
MGKGKLSGSARKVINQRRAAEAVKDLSDDIAFGRVTKLLGFNHIMVAIPVKSGSKEIRVRIPKLFTKKGATPITTREIVAIYVGKDFSPDEVKSTDQFDITAILTIKQANDLVQSGEIPRWMVHEEVISGNAHFTEADKMGWEYGYSDSKDEKDDEELDKDAAAAAVVDKTTKVPKAAKAAKAAKNKVVFGNSADDDDGTGSTGSTGSTGDKDVDVDAI